jgi:hypothetical protein
MKEFVSARIISAKKLTKWLRHVTQAVESASKPLALVIMIAIPTYVAMTTCAQLALQTMIARKTGRFAQIVDAFV